MKVLVGYTGFVGGNLNQSTHFDAVYNSKNITDAYGTNPDLLVYCGVRAEKYIANQNPQDDLLHIEETIKNIKSINAKKLVLISTIDIYQNPINVDETHVECSKSHKEAYGRNRLILEEWVINNIKDYHIIRLPGLFGKGIKKNFIYDLIHVIPFKMPKEKLEYLCKENQCPNILNAYHLGNDGFYKVLPLEVNSKNILKNQFLSIGFSALNFTDSRGYFQFYPLSMLWSHIEIIIKHNIKMINLATEPIQISALYKAIYDRPFVNEIATKIPHYDFRTIHASLFSGAENYILNCEQVISNIIMFIHSETE